MLPYTDHANLRIFQRRISRDDVDYVLRYGFRIPQVRSVHCRLRPKDLPKLDRDQDWARALVGTELVLAEDDSCLITAYCDHSRGFKETQRRKDHLQIFHRRQPYWEEE